MKKYNFYPTLLDAFIRNSPDLLDRVNRVPQPKSEYAEKGKAYHKLTEGDEIPGVDLVRKKEEEFYHFGFWDFPRDCVEEMRAIRAGGVHEVFVSRELEIESGTIVNLYGYIDTLKDGECKDVKTTGFYKGISFLESAQRLVYPFITGGRGLDFLITDFSFIYGEYYCFTPADLERLRAICYQFIVWLEDHRELITDFKVFGK